MNKYYTPEIEEFHVGFEYEEKDIEWEKAVCGTYDAGDFDALGDVSREGNIRVKHLDREDIESIGLKDVSFNGRDVWESDFKHKRYESHVAHVIVNLDHCTGDGVWVLVCTGDTEVSYDDWQTVFAGHIKNKSELKRILKQIGV